MSQWTSELNVEYALAPSLGLSAAGSAVISAAAWNVYYVYPATAASGGTKDLHVIYASATDWSATGAVMGMSANQQNIGLEPPR